MHSTSFGLKSSEEGHSLAQPWRYGEQRHRRTRSRRVERSFDVLESKHFCCMGIIGIGGNWMSRDATFGRKGIQSTCKNPFET